MTRVLPPPKLTGAPWWHQPEHWPAGIPTLTLMSTAPAMIVIAFKILIELPPLSWVLSRVRSGQWASQAWRQSSVAQPAVFCVAKHQ